MYDGFQEEMKKGCLRRLLLFLWLLCLGKMLYGASLQELTQRAIANNRDLRAARYTVRLAQARLIQAGLWPNPALTLGDTDDRFFTNEGEYTRSFAFSQAFPISGRLARQQAVAVADVLKAFAEVQEAQRQLASKVASAFFTALITERRLQQLNYLIQFNKELIKVIANRYHAAEVSELDKNTINIEYERLLQEKALLKAALIQQKIRLRQLMGATEKVRFILDSPRQISFKLPPLTRLINLALKNRPDRQMLLALLEKGKADARLARAERFADWTLAVGVQEDRIAVEGAPAQKPDRALNVNLTIPIPLLNQNQGRIREASAFITQTQLQIDALNLSISNEVENNYQQLQVLQHHLQASQSTLSHLSQSNLKLARDAYSAGQISFLNVLQVQRQQNDMQMTFLTTMEQFLKIYVALCTEIGPGDTAGLCPYLSFAGGKQCV